DDLPRLGAYGQMKPPLIPAAQVELFWERLALVDMIASDHAPHARDEKDSDTPPPGVPGLETTLPLLLYAVDAGRLSPVRMIELIYHNPLRVYGLSGPVDTEVEVALEGVYRFPERGYQTRCGWTPFAGQPALGRIVSVRLHGQIVYRDGEVLATPGFGRLLVRA
ncbi:MAG TPA: dihydroorotase, partial [Chloroflexi bacterium]|nr:dihydroorotase [Chloroflexota bacterium]